MRQPEPDLAERLEELHKSHADLEEQVALLQNLYTASVQLLGAKGPRDVVRIIGEVLENLVGATEFAMFIWRKGERGARLILRKGPPDRAITPEVMAALKSTQPTVLRAADGTLAVAVAPLHYEKNLIGTVLIDKLLPQKGGELSAGDMDLLSLLSAQAAPALWRAQERARAEAQNAAVEKLLDNKKTGGLPSVQGDLDETKLVEVLQLVSMTRKSGRLKVVDEQRRNIELVFRRGALLQVLAGGRVVPLERASAALCVWLDRSGTFTFFTDVDTVPNDAPLLSCDELVMDALRLQDERSGPTIKAVP